jgi:hypothetical protein
MPYLLDRAASRFGRDRNVFPDRQRFGPYESPYDVRRGYQEPLRRIPRRDEEERAAFFLGREPGDVEEEEAEAEE